MFDLALILMLIALPLLAIASGFLSGTETALFSLGPQQRRRLTHSKSVVGRALNLLLAETRTLLITLLMSNMTVNVLYFVISTVALIHMQNAGNLSALGAAIIAPIQLLTIIFIGEVLPKTLASRSAARWSSLAAIPLLAIHRLLTPLRIVADALIITPLARLIAPRTAPPMLHADELQRLLQAGRENGLLADHEKIILSNAVRLGSLKVGDIMVPRVRVIAHNLDEPPARLTEAILHSNRHHIPAYRSDLDNVLGVIEAKQLALADPADAEALERIIRPAIFVPEQQTADRLLVTLRRKGVTIAIVVDEYGGTAGIVSLKDVVNALVAAPDSPAAGDIS